MKRRILIVISVIALFAFTIAAYAYTRSSVATERAISCCCCEGDSCPMKKKEASDSERASCCDNCDSCKGDACPMKKTEGASTTAAEAHKEAGTHAEGCSCSCCKDKKAEGSA